MIDELEDEWKMRESTQPSADVEPAQWAPPTATSAVPPVVVEAHLSPRVERFRESLWVLPTLVFGFFTWASFLYIGRRTKRRGLLVWAGIYAAGLVGFIAIPVPRDAAGKAMMGHWQSSLSMVLFYGVWIGGFAHAVLVNRRLGATARAERAERRRREQLLDSSSLGMPWRSYVDRPAQRVDAVTRMVDATPPGPRHERLSPLTDRLRQAAEPIAQLAHAGNALQQRRAVLEAQAQMAPAVATELASVSAELTALEQRLEKIDESLDAVVREVAELSVAAAEPDDGPTAEQMVEAALIEVQSIASAAREVDVLDGGVSIAIDHPMSGRGNRPGDEEL